VICITHMPVERRSECECMRAIVWRTVPDRKRRRDQRRSDPSTFQSVWAFTSTCRLPQTAPTISQERDAEDGRQKNKRRHFISISAFFHPSAVMCSQANKRASWFSSHAGVLRIPTESSTRPRRWPRCGNCLAFSEPCLENRARGCQDVWSRGSRDPRRIRESKITLTEKSEREKGFAGRYDSVTYAWKYILARERDENASHTRVIL